ncbi:unnamed protein product [Lymnaea stagnalis]|uniref:alpha-mannosidase n=1 Tax=Lymnaea stagnalis TaxID=6523 RepID=A0AAV2H6W8_LYMST
MDHVTFKHKRTTLERAEKFISNLYFTDVNLRGRLYREKAPLTSIKHYAAPDRITYQKALEGHYEPASIGQSFGPVWSTHWFELVINIPVAWKGQEVHLLWNSGTEALVWVNGEPQQGLSADNDRISYILSPKLKKSFVSLQPCRHTIYIEMACNHLFGIGNVAIVTPEDDQKRFTLNQAEVAVFDRDVFNLILDVETLHDIAKELPEDDQRGYQALYAVNDIMNQLDVTDKSTFRRVQEIAEHFFTQRNGQSQHTLYAMGHAHIDTGIHLFISYYHIKTGSYYSGFMHPSCLGQSSPPLHISQRIHFLKTRLAVASPISLSNSKIQVHWISVNLRLRLSDGNIPSGEACIRQFLYGQQFFKEEFGVHCKEFWLPDTFGYSAQFPQIMRHCGVTRFLTQKLSWSLVNKFPHHTFHWEGIDGSTILAHFPPGDSYNMVGKVEEMLKTTRNFRDKGRSNRSAFLYGYGDGGHGPSEEMLQRLTRLKDCDGIPKVKFTSSDEFFSSIEQENTKLLCKWRGELYLEMHNGTYTTWAKVKKYNRQCEIWLQELETLSTMAHLKDPGFEYPKAELDRLWKLLLLNQFHDVLPGSSINLVFQDAIKYYEEIEKTSTELINKALKACTKTQGETDSANDVELYVVNTQGFTRQEVIELPPTITASPASKKRKLSENSIGVDGDGPNIAEVSIPPLSMRPLRDCLVKIETNSEVILTREDDHYVMTNGIIKAVIDSIGRVTSLTCFDKLTKRWSKEAIDQQHPANQFLLYDDIPLYWDAWDVMDYHLETRSEIKVMYIRRAITPLDSHTTTICICDFSLIQVSLKISDKSYLKQEIVLDAGSSYITFNTEVTWFENRKFLKVEFPTTVHANQVTYDIQSGFLQRPNHYNTSWDSARYEVCGHKWVDISEHGFGVSVLNNCKYGHSAVEGVLRLSLLRSSKTPDPKADMGEHTFSYALMPHWGSFQEADVIQAALVFNSPLRVVNAPTTNHSGDLVSKGLFTLDTKQVVVQAIKMAEDGSQTIILRLHEAFGGTTSAIITSTLPIQDVQACNGLEDSVHLQDTDREVAVKFTPDNRGCQFTLDLLPFQIISLRCTL